MGLAKKSDRVKSFAANYPCWISFGELKDGKFKAFNYFQKKDSFEYSRIRTAEFIFYAPRMHYWPLPSLLNPVLTFALVSDETTLIHLLQLIFFVSIDIVLLNLLKRNYNLARNSIKLALAKENDRRAL